MLPVILGKAQPSLIFFRVNSNLNLNEFFMQLSSKKCNGGQHKPNTMQTGEQTALNNPVIPGFLPSASIRSLG